MASPTQRSWAPLEILRLREQMDELTHVGTWRWCPETNDLYWSDNLFRLYGLEPGQIDPSWQWVLERTHPHDRARFNRGSDALAGPAGGAAIEYRFMPPGFGVRHLRWAVATVEREPGRPDWVWGVVQDFTEQARLALEVELQAIAMRALLDWGPFESGVERLLHDLGGALDCELGVMWVSRGDMLVPRVVWHDASLGAEIEPAIRALRLSTGRGLAGRAWASARPVSVASLTQDDRYEPHQIAVRAGLRAAAALPAHAAGEVLAVLSFGARAPTGLTGISPEVFAAIGADVGAFLARRRGELLPASLTPRELEILRLAAHGHPVHRLAAVLGISSSTVKTHLEQIYRKLGVSDRTAAVAEMMRRGLID